ncbi:MAG: MFS transporter [Bacillota bacterium]
MKKCFNALKGMRRELLLFFILIGVVAFANGLSDSIFSNYYKDAYDINEVQRAFIEIPREIPGLICVLIISALSFIGDFRIAFIAQLLSCIGITVLGFITPSFSIMLIFLFINSLGMHLFMPLSDKIGMSLAEPDKVGVRVGQYGSVKTAVAFFTGILVFVGFYTDFFSFTTDIKWVFVISGIGFFVAAVVAFLLVKETKKNEIVPTKTKFKFLFRKEYKYYYLLTVLHGVQKQIAYVFGSWVIVDLLLKGADVMSLLTIASSFLGIFFFRFVGKWLDTKGIKFMMFFDALSFIFVYTIYGFVVLLITKEVLPDSSFLVMIIYVLFVLDRLSMQVGVVKSVYMRRIALDPSEVTRALSTGTSLDHAAAIIAAQISGLVWAYFGAHWVFFIAAFFSLGNLFVAFKIKEPKIN